MEQTACANARDRLRKAGTAIMKQQRKSFPLRIHPELYRELESWAQQEMRSVNGQIEFLLKQAVDRRRSSKEESDQQGDS